MSNLIEAAPEEPGNGSGGTNRAFVLIALGLASVLVVGLLLIFGYVAGSRLGFFGPRVLASPDGTATAVALAGATSASAGTLLPAAVTSAAATAVASGTRVPLVTERATLPGQAATGTTVAGAAGTINPAAATPSVVTPTPTRVVGGSVSTPVVAATNTSAVNTLAPGAVTPANPAGGAVSGGAAVATATPSGPGTGSSLPGTGVDLDILIMGILMVILLVLARGFRMALRS